jgi:hypothetical protein
MVRLLQSFLPDAGPYIGVQIVKEIVDKRVEN